MSCGSGLAGTWGSCSREKPGVDGRYSTWSTPAGRHQRTLRFKRYLAIVCGLQQATDGFVTHATCSVCRDMTFAKGVLYISQEKGESPISGGLAQSDLTIWQ